MDTSDEWIERRMRCLKVVTRSRDIALYPDLSATPKDVLVTLSEFLRGGDYAAVRDLEAMKWVKELFEDLKEPTIGLIAPQLYKIGEGAGGLVTLMSELRRNGKPATAERRAPKHKGP